MNPSLLPHRITETTESLALFACGYDPDWDEALVAELDQSDGAVYLAAQIALRLCNMLEGGVCIPYLRIVN